MNILGCFLEGKHLIPGDDATEALPWNAGQPRASEALLLFNLVAFVMLW